MNEKMKLKEFMLIFKRRFWFMVLTSISFTGLIIITSMYVVKPTYEYSIQVMVGFSGEEETGKTSNKMDENRQLAISITDIIQSPHIMAKVIEQLDLDQSSYELLEKISVKNRDNSQVITITVKNSDPKLTKDIALAIINQSILNFKDYVNTQQFHILNDSESKQYANLLFPKPLFVIVISIVVGIFAGIGSTLFREQLDDKFYNVQEIEQLGIPLLGMVKLNAKKKRKKQKPSYKPVSLENLGDEIEI